MLDTRAAVVRGDSIAIPIDEHGRCRNVIVSEVFPFGVEVIWYTPRGVGPFRRLMPHADLAKILYVPESSGRHKSHYAKTDQEIVDDHKIVAKEIKD
jgi:hypothetical protein